MFEEIQGKDLCKGNPWLDPLIVTERRKEVCFTISEISPPQLPHCRRVDEEGEYGHLHSRKCENYEELDCTELCNRAHVLSVYFPKPFPLYIDYGKGKKSKYKDRYPLRKRDPPHLLMTTEMLEKFMDEHNTDNDSGFFEG